MKTIFKHMFRRGQTGQTLVILAFGFIVLLGFVGIVTDVSLLFVRYSTLRRAVDSAAVAAAGQLRRATPTQAEYDEAAAKSIDPNGIAYARNLATINLAARQFIEFYGLSPEDVLVETCQSTNYKDVELCTDDQRKLVRVTAQVASPTVFLRLLGWGTVTLEASAISESAVLDVVLIMDVSESMLDTTRPDWCIDVQDDDSCPPDKQTARFLPPRMDKAEDAWLAVNPGGDLQLYSEELLAMDHPDVLANTYIANQTRNPWVMNGSTMQQVDLSDSRVPRPTCRVRYFPAAWEVTPDLLAEYRLLDPSFPSVSSNFVPMYDFFGCCNDPNGDGNFSDLICEPFKSARDASLGFIKQVDFARGDRVGIVTFDRGATLMKPIDGGGASSMLETEADAHNVLTTSVGVRAEESFYNDADGDGRWDTYVVTNIVDTSWPGVKPEAASSYNRYWDSEPVGLLTDVPTKRNCPFLMASAYGWRSLWSSEDNTDPERFPNPLISIMMPNFTTDAAWAAKWATYNRGNDLKANYSYELRASCAGTNIGGALRTANNALLEEGRSNGAVWVMVFLSDGGAGASDQGNRPVRADAGEYLFPANPYMDNPANNPSPGEYGVYGVCPTGTTGNPSELIEDDDPDFPYCSDLLPETRHFCFDPNTKDANNSIYIDVTDPACSETSPYDVDDFARDWADYVGLIDPFPALADADVDTSSEALLPTIFTIGFNLRFSGDTVRCKDGAFPAGDTEECLGEELLRYIADVGDNFQIDSDYQQDLRFDGQLNLGKDPDDVWGGRGPCEDPIEGYARPEDMPAGSEGLLVNPKFAGENCGNYFNAASGDILTQVFDEIAARMFTRLSR